MELVSDCLGAFTPKNDNPFSFITCLGTELPLVWDGRSPTTQVKQFHTIIIFFIWTPYSFVSDAFSESKSPHFPANLTTFSESAHHTLSPRSIRLEPMESPGASCFVFSFKSNPSHTMKHPSSRAAQFPSIRRAARIYRESWHVPFPQVTWGGIPVSRDFGRSASGTPQPP